MADTQLTTPTITPDVLIAEDDPVSHHALTAALTRGGYRIIPASNGTEAWEAMQLPTAPRLAILDWMMPELDGLQLCRQLKSRQTDNIPYLILLTSKGDREQIVEGLEAGADDYIVKPFDSEELRARVRVGFRILRLQDGLASRIVELEQAFAQITQLQGLLPICCYCKKIRDDGNYWHQVEEYLSQHADVQFSHGICPHCYQKEFVPQLEAFKAKKTQTSSFHDS